MPISMLLIGLVIFSILFTVLVPYTIVTKCFEGKIVPGPIMYFKMSGPVTVRAFAHIKLLFMSNGDIAGNGKLHDSIHPLLLNFVLRCYMVTAITLFWHGTTLTVFFLK